MRGIRARRLVLGAMSLAASAVVGVAAATAAPPTPVVPPVTHTHGPDPKILDPRGRAPAATYAVDTALTPAWSSSEHDGKAFTTDQVDLTSYPTVHALYVYPSNKSSRFTSFAAMFQADARAASGLLSTLYGRAIRLDDRLGTDGTTRYLDITAFKSKHSAAKLGSGNQFSLVNKELTDRGFNVPGKKYLVWLDAGSQYCGQAHLSQDTQRTASNGNEGRTLAIVYRPYDARNADGGFCRGRTALHELGHSLGALQKVAPSAFDGAHCDDDDSDAMCYTSEATYDSGSAQFDYGNDDYWDPAAGKLGWWTANLSSWVCPLSGCGDASQPNY